METHTKPKHRHIIVGPIMVLLFLNSFWTGQVQFKTETTADTAPDEVEKVIDIAYGTKGLLSKGSAVTMDDNTPSLERGSILLKSNNLLSVQAGDLSLLSLPGAFQVSRDENTVTVAALTTPVLVQKENAAFIVPARMQWKYEGELPAFENEMSAWISKRMAHALPEHFLEKSFLSLQKLSLEPWKAPSPVKALEEKDTSSVLLLEKAEERKAQKYANEILGYMGFVISENNAEELALILEDPDLHLLATTDTKNTLLQYLFESNHQSITGHLLDFLSRDPALLLLLSFHPQFAALSFTHQIADAEIALNRTAFLPLAAQGEEGFSGFVYERWESDFDAFLKETDHPADVLSGLLPVYAKFIDIFEHAGYPSRARTLAAALVRLTGDYPSLTGEANQALSVIKKLEHVEVSLREESDMEVAPVSEPVAQVPVINAEQAETSLHLFLAKAGALFTVETSIQAVETGTVEVNSIVFAGSEEDSTYSFSYNPTTGTISKIVKNGQKLPYPLPLQSFMEWLKK